MMRFHGYFRSSSAHRCRIAFNLKGLSPDFTSVHLRRGGGEQKTPVFRALNPQGLVPTLETDEGVLTQSLAIIEWLDELQPEPPLLPSDPFARAKVRALAQTIACDIHPLQNLRVLQYLREELGQDQSALDRWCQRWISDGLTACEALLRDTARDGDFAFGAHPGLADICIVPQVYSARRFGVDMAAMPRVQAVFDACEGLAAFQNARPDNQPDTEN
ncbi:MAG: maleylacetoacetate isomerase [Pararhodobacter sp.]|nr:maleylacetoacetate isomerase [Pararhodobacter sp.]